MLRPQGKFQEQKTIPKDLKKIKSCTFLKFVTNVCYELNI